MTGMSGAGKTQAVNALEDIGYYCVDNIPPRLITKFAELPGDSGNRINKVALVVDMRSQELFSEYAHCLDELARQQIPHKTLFLDCGDSELFNRYKETRRRHPLHSEGQPDIGSAIARERKLLAAAKERAHFVVDTTRMGATQLRARVREIFLEDPTGAMVVVCSSFGFKNGIPSDSDLLFDVRCLPNPFYLDELRPLTGLNSSVRDYVLGSIPAKGLIPKLLDLVDYLIPLYRQEGKSQLVVSIGCTGGQHRSVAFCELLAVHLAKSGIPAKAIHRDIQVDN